MNERDGVEEAAEQNEGSAHHAEPREPIIERIVAVDGTAAAAGIGSDAGAGAAAAG